MIYSFLVYSLLKNVFLFGCIRHAFFIRFKNSYVLAPSGLLKKLAVADSQQKVVFQF